MLSLNLFVSLPWLSALLARAAVAISVAAEAALLAGVAASLLAPLQHRPLQVVQIHKPTSIHAK